MYHTLASWGQRCYGGWSRSLSVDAHFDVTRPQSVVKPAIISVVVIMHGHDRKVSRPIKFSLARTKCDVIKCSQWRWRWRQRLFVPRILASSFICSPACSPMFYRSLAKLIMLASLRDLDIGIPMT